MDYNWNCTYTLNNDSSQLHSWTTCQLEQGASHLHYYMDCLHAPCMSDLNNATRLKNMIFRHPKQGNPTFIIILLHHETTKPNGWMRLHLVAKVIIVEAQQSGKLEATLYAIFTSWTPTLASWSIGLGIGFSSSFGIYCNDLFNVSPTLNKISRREVTNCKKFSCSRSVNMIAQ